MATTERARAQADECAQVASEAENSEIRTSKFSPFDAESNRFIASLSCKGATVRLTSPPGSLFIFDNVWNSHLEAQAILKFYMCVTHASTKEIGDTAPESRAVEINGLLLLCY